MRLTGFLFAFVGILASADPVPSPHVFGAKKTQRYTIDEQKGNQSTRAILRMLQEAAKLLPSELSEEIRDILVEAEMSLAAIAKANETCGFKTCQGKYCEKTNHCQHFTKDFCGEYLKKKKGEFCVGFGTACRNEKTGDLKDGHSNVIVDGGQDTLCLVEPILNMVVSCWRSSKRGNDLVSGMSHEAKQSVYRSQPHLLKCGEGFRSTMFPRDPMVGYEESTACCECSDADGKNRVSLFPFQNPYYCEGACRDRKQVFRERGKCDENELRTGLAKYAELRKKQK